jgi:hypothetical protein
MNDKNWAFRLASRPVSGREGHRATGCKRIAKIENLLRSIAGFGCPSLTAARCWTFSGRRALGPHGDDLA